MSGRNDVVCLRTAVVSNDEPMVAEQNVVSGDAARDRIARTPSNRDVGVGTCVDVVDSTACRLGAVDSQNIPGSHLDGTSVTQNDIAARPSFNMVISRSANDDVVAAIRFDCVVVTD